MIVSVIIPTYNSSQFVVEAVSSVLAQTSPAHEVIVVDDGSTDDTKERIAAFASRVRYIRKENGGVSSARNLGMVEARGDYLAFLDADDVWHPNKLELQTKLLRSHPDVGMIGTRVYAWPGSHQEYRESEPPRLQIIPFERLIVRNCLVTSTILAKADVIRAVGTFDITMQGPEDYDFWIRVAKVAKIANLEIALTGYRSLTPGSLSKNAERMETSMFTILDKLEAEGEFAGRPILRRKAWAYARSSCAFMHSRSGGLKAANRHLIRSLIGYPFPFFNCETRIPFARWRLLLATSVHRLRGTQFPPI